MRKCECPFISLALVIASANDGGLMSFSYISGFVKEGRKRQAVWMDNHWEDFLTMGILRDEWEGQR